jgi:hypothetical protein
LLCLARQNQSLVLPDPSQWKPHIWCFPAKSVQAIGCIKASVPGFLAVRRLWLRQLQGRTGVHRAVEVTDETLYEAAALALSVLRRDEWASVIGSSRVTPER